MKDLTASERVLQTRLKLTYEQSGPLFVAQHNQFGLQAAIPLCILVPKLADYPVPLAEKYGTMNIRPQTVVLAVATLAAVTWLVNDRFFQESIKWRNTASPSTCCLDIAHAGGSVNGVAYSNSLEALNNSVSDGRKLLEIDVLMTADGHLVLAHDWNKFGGKAPSLIVFLSGSNALTPLTYVQFLQWRNDTCPTCTVVTDFKDDFVEILSKFNELTPENDRQEHFIVQTYSVAEALEFGKEFPNQKQILTLYRSPPLTHADIESLQKLHSLYAVTMPLRMLAQVAPWVHETLKLPVLTHGRPVDMANAMILRKARSAGANGFYRE